MNEDLQHLKYLSIFHYVEVAPAVETQPVHHVSGEAAPGEGSG